MKARNTVQRGMVLDAVRGMHHPTAEEVYGSIHQGHPSVSKATVYRNLNQLTEHGALRRVQVPGGADRYDTTLQDHYHVRCRQCGLVEDAALPWQDTLMQTLAGSGGFLVEEHDIVLRGLCPHCRSTQPTR